MVAALIHRLSGTIGRKSAPCNRHRVTQAVALWDNTVAPNHQSGPIIDLGLEFF